MNLFNQQYEKVYRTNRNSLSIKKYLKQYETDGEKFGGTIKHIFEQYPRNIPNFQELLSYDIKDYNNVFFLEFIYILFIDSNSYIIWDILCNFANLIHFTTKRKIKLYFLVSSSEVLKKILVM